MQSANETYLMGREERASFLFGHFAMFAVYVWFGALKLFDSSPANPLVADLYTSTIGHVLPFLSAHGFIVCLGVLEVVIGICFIVPSLQRVGLMLLVAHMVTTILPLFFLTSMTWSAPFVPTLEGQYIIKNIVIIALATSIYVDSKKKFSRRLR